MINFGIIGTNWITHSYIAGAQATGKWNLAAVYSRKEDTAKEFASKYEGQKISIHTTLESLASDSNISAVYIASPNSLHYEHAKLILETGKHVVLEKPATCTSAQLSTLFEIAHSKKVVLIEAFRHLHEKNMITLKKSLGKLGPIFGASLNYAQYSSRYDAVLAGERPNIFTLDFGGGSLVDLGVYCVAASIFLFGAPKSSKYYPVILEQTGADGGGTLTLEYEGFAVTIIASKIFASAAPSEVFGRNGTLVVPTITDIESVTYLDPKKKGEKELNLKEEAEEYARIIGEGDWEAVGRWEELSKAVIAVTEGCRRENGLLFPVEREGKD
ncbi:oxidoreductase-like protein [Lophiotrema nucula]|uniref:Oxidoreductase-like protein n=1 Tax=Lophiotrema nucula TaxID=690887 RepID=A0A6A5ZUK6_9PLEO|nr:oxidoreductase-like protein [Lophiotrema nucula]